MALSQCEYPYEIVYYQIVMLFMHENMTLSHRLAPMTSIINIKWVWCVNIFDVLGKFLLTNWQLSSFFMLTNHIPKDKIYAGAKGYHWKKIQLNIFMQKVIRFSSTVSNKTQSGRINHFPVIENFNRRFLFLLGWYKFY